LSRRARQTANPEISENVPSVPRFPFPPLSHFGFPIRKRALTGRINPTNIKKNIIVFTRRTRGKEESFRHAAATHSRQSRNTRGWLTTSPIVMGNAQNHTMTTIMTHATRFPAASPVQITMSATIITVREANPKIWPISRFRTRTHSIVEGSSRKTPSVSKKAETWKILGRTLRLPPYWGGKCGDEIWGPSGSFLMFLSARIKYYRKRSVCPQVSGYIPSVTKFAQV
jgi:hypothetical protein